MVEGQGDERAAPALLHRLGQDLGHADFVWDPVVRGNGIAFEGGLRKHVEIFRPDSRLQGLLVLRDEDDGCPKNLAPRDARVLSSMALPFPSAIVLAVREFESLFLASIPSLAGRRLPAGAHDRPGLSVTARAPEDPETVRDAKGWLTRRWSEGRAYKPSTDQLPLARFVDFRLVRSSGLRWFGSLERALRFLAGDAGPGDVYPRLA